MEPRPVERRLAAIVATDVAGYSRLMGLDEVGTLRALKGHREELIDPAIAEHHGRIVKTMGDGLLVEFASAVEAVACALVIQRGMCGRNAAVQPEKRIVLRCGINLGDVIVEDKDIYGDGINVAARLQALSEPGGILLSRAVRDQIRDKLDVALADRGELALKNIARPVRAFGLSADSSATSAPTRSSEHAAWKAPATPASVEALSRPSIAVLPFENMSGDPEQEYFASGVVEDITTALARLRWLFVIARNSSFAYGGRAVDVKQIGRELGVRYVLEGSIRKAGSRIRSAAQLIETASGGHIWADRYDRDLSDIFALQAELAQSVVAAIEPSLFDVEIVRAKAKPTESLEAYDYYLRALWERRTTAGENCLEATVLLRHAIELDPNYAEALAALADCILDQKNRGLIEDADRANEEARQFAMRAVAADPESGSVLAIAADTLLCSGDAQRALSLAERALRALPGSAFVLNRCGKVYVHNGEYDKAASYFEASLKINPRDPRGNDAYNGLAFAHFFARRFDDAVYWARRMAAETIVQSPTRRFAAAALAHLGRRDEARAEITEVLKLQPNSSLARSRQSSFAQAWMLELYIDGLRKAGLPEN